MRAGEDPAAEAALANPSDDPEAKKARERAAANQKARSEAWKRWLELLKAM